MVASSPNGSRIARLRLPVVGSRTTNKLFSKTYTYTDSAASTCGIVSRPKYMTNEWSRIVQWYYWKLKMLPFMRKPTFWLRVLRIIKTARDIVHRTTQLNWNALYISYSSCVMLCICRYVDQVRDMNCSNIRHVPGPSPVSCPFEPFGKKVVWRCRRVRVCELLLCTELSTMSRVASNVVSAVYVRCKSQWGQA